MPVKPLRLPAQAASEEFIESKIQFMTDVHLWPERQKLDPYPWLANFKTHERQHALNLLNVFIYYNDTLVDALFRAAVQRLSSSITQSATSLSEAKTRWRTFLSTVRITYVEGEDPNPTDSGRLFARKARQVLEIDEGDILDPARTIGELQKAPNSVVLLVDDFVGAGDQMRKAWTRPYDLNGRPVGSFAAAAQNGATIMYVPLIAASRGLDVLAHLCPELQVNPAHTLDTRYSLTDTESILWPELLKPSALDFLLEASRRAGIVDNCDVGWKGFHDLSLAIAFAHSVPDATLPLYYWDQNGWAPLLRRT